VWTQLKKKPVSVYRGAHSRGGGAPAAGAAADGAAAAPAPPARGSWATAGSEAVAWVQSVAVARGSDLAASGAGDGAVKLWAVEQSKHGGAGYLRPLGELPALGFVNGLAVERRGRLVVAAVGPEPRLGRWGKVEGARPGLVVHALDVAPEEDE
jgi:ribosomal RNA-processing protein 9